MHPQGGLGGAEHRIRRNPGLCSWRLLPLPCCRWSSANTQARVVNYREKALLGWGGIKIHPWKDHLPFLQPRKVLWCILMKAKHLRLQQNASCRSSAVSGWHLRALLEPRAVQRDNLPKELAPRWGHEQCGQGHGGRMMLRGAGRARNSSWGLIQRGERSRLTRQRDCSFHGPLCRRMSHLGERNC